MEGLREVRVALFLRGIRRIGIDAQSGGAFGAETEIDVEDAKEAANQKTRTHQKNTGESNLRDNQRTANPGVAAALGGAAGRILERVMQREAANLKGGKNSEDDAGEKGDKQSE